MEVDHQTNTLGLGVHVARGEALHVLNLARKVGSSTRHVVFGKDQYAFVRTVDDANGGPVHWCGTTLGPHLHVAITVLENDRLVLAHTDARGERTVEEHASAS